MAGSVIQLTFAWLLDEDTSRLAARLKHKHRHNWLRTACLMMGLLYG